GVELEAAVAGVLHAIRRLHGEEGRAGDGEVERPSGLNERALAEVDRPLLRSHGGRDRPDRGGAAAGEPAEEHLPEILDGRAARLVAGCADVGKVLTDGELATEFGHHRRSRLIHRADHISSVLPGTGRRCRRTRRSATSPTSSAAFAPRARGMPGPVSCDACPVCGRVGGNCWISAGVPGKLPTKTRRASGPGSGSGSGSTVTMTKPRSGMGSGSNWST